MTVTKIGSFDFDKKIKALRREKVKLPKIIANTAKNHFVLGFRKGGRMTNDSMGGWKKRQWHRFTPSGRISKSSTANILIKSGRLRRSVRATSKRWDNITISSDLPYSEIHNDGGKIRQVVTAKQAAFFGHMGAKFKKQGNFFMAKAYNKFAEANVLNIDIPKREFIGKSRKLDKKIIKLIDREYLNILSK